ncbi:hypothetical protein CMV_001182 [Castanea mollissima]|uniref:Uncharacterized protein n=1 Tax=Castanea mollissima TaxID=60419 RepID=A0A8J4W4K3_9ROSI|nr:hypothetical protein CMV_001182 [Castanea mollissima]
MDCGCWVAMSGGRRLQDPNLAELAIMGMGFFFKNVDMGLGSESYVDLFGFEEEEWAVIGFIFLACLFPSYTIPNPRAENGSNEGNNGPISLT